MLPEKRTLALKEFKHALKTWQQTPAFARCADAQLFHYYT
jgi:hypothetical protein